MEKHKKYALLDTDFLYKTHLARNSENHTLAEFVLEFVDYEFFCHEMIKEELTRREIEPDPNPWLEEKILAGKIKLYSDRDILNELMKVYVFCSDDFKARQSITSLTKPINCISILGVFYRLMKMGHSKEEMQEYYCRLAAFLKNQTDYRGWSLSGHQRIRIPIMQVLDDIYDEKFQLLKNGDLQYIRE